MINPRGFIEDISMQAFSCQTARFQTYQAERIDGVLYIIGVGKPLKGGSVLFHDTCDENQLLVSLLQLYEYLDPTLYGHFDERVRDVDIARIIHWCNAHGLPMEDSITKEDSLWRKHSKVGFRVRDFYNRLHDLYICYLLWRRIEYGDTADDNFYSLTPIEECKEYFHGHMLALEIRIHPDFQQYPPKYYLECENYMGVAKAQMFFISMSQDEYSIGVCSVCAAPFVKKRKNNTLCPDCQLTKSRRSREKARAAKKSQKKD